jgi:hypothetical protein
VSLQDDLVGSVGGVLKAAGFAAFPANRQNRTQREDRSAVKLLLTGRLPTGCIWTGDDRKGSIAGLHCQKPLGGYVQEMCCVHV